MAAQRALEDSERPGRRLFEDPLARRFVTGRLAVVCALRQLPVVGRIAPSLYDWVAGPCPRASAIARTRFIDDAVCRSVADGIREVVLLGAGFDTRAYRLACMTSVDLFEVDHEDTQRRKVRVLTGLEKQIERVRYVACDFERQAFDRPLLDAGYRADLRSMFVWEGVTNYLSPQTVEAMFDLLAELMAARSVLAFTYVDRAALSPATAHRFPEAKQWTRSVAAAGEPWRSGFNPVEVESFLADAGFSVECDRSTREIGEELFGAVGRRERGSEMYRVVFCRREGR